ncbi:spermidine/putrescine ABC transporter substrate-binding protein [Pseudomonas gingeri NCPPB 3146 = LMG 5327]|uniref:Extracellular solute-binding protein n=2 Tax=Pseudomonas gingeri TaxID=117681 RepID=A0A7Y7XWF9_9PSED|nr:MULTISPECIES: extracellular solute-binding protein [Pseudomonas]NVZ24566.1 extracellular solute-binding protein [Pseudomonas gingeri]NWC13369.1 extracellular solute-binding protein [Pseudomonas gingeri]PNQ92327.1 spermidine/putrescine ABC transporter substrate-binding protein [Pseudomonas gingeri NCPPB 3146 = LMG 5327]BBP77261.1 spermidine/putrescine ABC transporter substrate-binding protein [Pseudomonas sp. Ost2]
MKKETETGYGLTGIDLNSISLKRRSFLLGAAASAAGLYIGSFVPSAFAASTGHLEILGWEGETGEAELADWRKQRGVTVRSSYASNQDDITARLAGTDPVQLDLTMYALGYEKIYKEMGLLKAIDTAKIPNYSADNTLPLFYKGSRWYWDGKQWGIPLLWGMNTIVYNPGKVSKPAEYKDLLDPKLKGRLTFVDDGTSNWSLIAAIGGYADKYPNLTHAEFNDAFEKLKPYRDQCRVFAASSGDAVSLLVSGEVDVVFSASANTPSETIKRGITTALSVPQEGAALWCDALFIPKTAKDIPLALEFINKTLEAETQAKMATTMFSGVVNPKAIPLLPSDLRNTFDYEHLDSFFEKSKLYGQPPLSSDQYVTYAEWIDQWANFKGSF